MFTLWKVRYDAYQQNKSIFLHFLKKKRKEKKL